MNTIIVFFKALVTSQTVRSVAVKAWKPLCWIASRLAAMWRWHWTHLGNAYARATFMVCVAALIVACWGWVRPVVYTFRGNSVLVPGAPGQAVTLHHWPGYSPVVNPSGRISTPSAGFAAAIKGGWYWVGHAMEPGVTSRLWWWRSLGTEAGICVRGPLAGVDWRPFSRHGLNVSASVGACWPWRGRSTPEVYVGVQAVLIERLF